MIWQGVHIGDDVFIGPRATFTNDLRPRAHRRREGDELLGTTVEAGASLMILEAMKMEHTVRAREAGTVRAIHVAPGDQVETDHLLAVVTA